VASEALMDGEAVAAYLGVPRKTLYHWTRQGGGPPSYRIGKHRKYRRSEVDAWVASRRDRGGSATSSR